MEDKYKRLTQAQIELWLDNPVTKYHLLSLESQIGDIEDKINSGSFRDPANNDITCNGLSYLEGQKSGNQVAHDPIALLNHYQMIEVKEDEDVKDNG